jgi:hypothetical protein
MDEYLYEIRENDRVIDQETEQYCRKKHRVPSYNKFLLYHTLDYDNFTTDFCCNLESYKHK